MYLKMRCLPRICISIPKYVLSICYYSPVKSNKTCLFKVVFSKGQVLSPYFITAFTLISGVIGMNVKSNTHICNCNSFANIATFIKYSIRGKAVKPFSSTVTYLILSSASKLTILSIGIVRISL